MAYDGIYLTDVIQCAGSKGRGHFAICGVWKGEFVGLRLFCDDSTTQATPHFVDGTRCAYIETPEGWFESNTSKSFGERLHISQRASIKHLMVDYARLAGCHSSQINLRHRGSWLRPSTLLAGIMSIDSSLIVLEAFVNWKRYYNGYDKDGQLRRPREPEDQEMS